MAGLSDADRYAQAIARFRAGDRAGLAEFEADELQRGIPALAEIEEAMESANQLIARVAMTDEHSIQEHIAYMLKKRVDFADSRFDSLFVDRNVSASYIVSKPNEHRKADKRLDYGYREKMAGFVVPAGAPKWDETKIQEFVDSVKNV
ncbi:hypothetical protein PAPHI01_0837 [Pancytospora philotis]|nr:hypothetical protein PAPHI01_0837 [Pancytospora philotis]